MRLATRSAAMLLGLVLSLPAGAQLPARPAVIVPNGPHYVTHMPPPDRRVNVEIPVTPPHTASTIAAREPPERPAPVAAPGPATIAAVPAAMPPGAAGNAITVPFDPEVGAAAFRRGDTATVVFDQRRPIDVSALRSDAVFAAAEVLLLPSATLLRMPLARDLRLQLTRTRAGWSIAAVDAASPPSPQPIRPELSGPVLQLAAEQPGKVVSIPDPETGLGLLVGTQRKPGQSVPITRRMPELTLLPTWQGVAVSPFSDALSLRSTIKGFVIEVGAGRALALSPPPVEAIAEGAAHQFSRRFDLPGQPLESLMLRLQAAVAVAAKTPAQARARKRLDVAQAMIALGFGAEAQSVIALAGIDDSRAAQSPDTAALAAVAAMLAGRPAEADGIDEPGLTGTDEIALWRAVRAAMLNEGAPSAAAVFAANLPLLLAYPAPLRDRLLPLAVETMVLGGEQEAAQRLLDTRTDDKRLGLARALALTQNSSKEGGELKPALEAFAQVAVGADRLARARALTRAVELRLAAGELTPVQAADALDRLIYSWRGDGRELALRQRVASLRRQASQWRIALALLRETEQMWPEQKAALRAQLGETFTAAVEQDAKSPLPPLDLVALADENADLIPEGAAGTSLAIRLAERLITLDLPKRAVPVLEKLVAVTPPGEARAELGSRLATMRLAQGDAAGAVAALAKSDAEGLPDALLQTRALGFARAAAALGDLPSAISALTQLASEPATALRAELLEAAKDWRGAEVALLDLAAKSVPAEGKLNEPQARLLLRLASAAAQAGDTATLTLLRERDTARLPDGKTADMLRLLTAAPVQGVSDLPRAAQEMKVARALPGALRTMTP